MKRSALICLMTIFTLGLFTTVESARAQSELNGAWKRIEASGHNDDGDWKITDPPPSLLIIHDGYYSDMHVSGEEKRPMYEEGETASTVSSEKLLAIYNSIVANSGTYEIEGSSITFNVLVAKIPNFMNGGTYTRTFRVENNKLYISGETSNGSTYRVTFQRLK